MDMKKNFQIAIKELVGEGSQAGKNGKKAEDAPKAPESVSNLVEKLKKERSAQAATQKDTIEAPTPRVATVTKQEPEKTYMSKQQPQPEKETKTYKEIQEELTKSNNEIIEPVKTAIYDYNASDSSENEIMVIPKGTSIHGNITTDGNMKIHGNVTGDINSLGKVSVWGEVNGNIVGQQVEMISSRMKGNINAVDSVIISIDTKLVGDISANTLRAEGKLKGNVVVKNGAELSSNAILLGNLTSSEILIEKGAVIRGEIKVILDDGVGEELESNDRKEIERQGLLDEFED
ncbi:MAG: polymer-forming cytoskeletal protein [Eubacteriales bacterium]|nr:polymer-forming cytoskeletal protein [Eubacteriales bacterium]MDD4390681.1 polymer-forming cytoskeletal protein [Eubacteriales bacterium]